MRLNQQEPWFCKHASVSENLHKALTDEQSSYSVWEHKWSSHDMFEKGLHSFGG